MEIRSLVVEMAGSSESCLVIESCLGLSDMSGIEEIEIETEIEVSEIELLLREGLVAAQIL